MLLKYLKIIHRASKMLFLEGSNLTMADLDSLVWLNLKNIGFLRHSNIEFAAATA